jgi:hypothetical protein
MNSKEKEKKKEKRKKKSQKQFFSQQSQIKTSLFHNNK